MTPVQIQQLADAIAVAVQLGMFFAFVAGFFGYLFAREIAAAIRWQYRIHRFKRHVAYRRGLEAARSASALLSSPLPAWLRGDSDVPSSLVDPLDDGEGGRSFTRGVGALDSSIRERDE